MSRTAFMFVIVAADFDSWPAALIICACSCLVELIAPKPAGPGK